MTAYYNEIDPYAAAWLRNLIAAGLIAPGDVDERSIVDVQPGDLRGYTQCHFFAGIGGWSYAARLAGFPDDRELWTGSCPCQPFSVAGKGEGQADTRHLWPEFFRLIGARRPDVVMGEQVAAAVGKHWLDGVCADLEGIDYAVGAAVVPACAVDAPHRRDRLWFVADADRNGSREGPDDQTARHGDTASADDRASALAYADSAGIRDQPRWLGGPNGAGTGLDCDNSEGALGDAGHPRLQGGEFSLARDGNGHGEEAHGSASKPSGAWRSAGWLLGAVGKARRIEPGIRLLAHGVPARVGKLRAYGNAIVPQVAAEVIGAYLDSVADRRRVRLGGVFD